MFEQWDLARIAQQGLSYTGLEQVVEPRCWFEGAQSSQSQTESQGIVVQTTLKRVTLLSALRSKSLLQGR
jgi:hypothetical protein